MMRTFSLCVGIIFLYFHPCTDDQRLAVCQQYLSQNTVIYHLRHNRKPLQNVAPEEY